MNPEVDMGAEDTAYRDRTMTEGPAGSDPADRGERLRRPDDSYQIAARIHSPSSARTRLATAVVAIVVVAWLGAAVTGRLPGPTATSVPSEVAVASPPGPVFVPVPPADSLPPDLEILQPTAPFGSIPVDMGGLVWLNLQTAKVGPRVDLAPDQWLFALPDGGAACVCLERETGTAPAALQLLRFAPPGRNVAASGLGDWLPRGQQILPVDAVLVAGGRDALIAALVEDGTRWDLRLQLADMEGNAPVVEGRLPNVDLSGLGDPSRVQLRLYATLDVGAPEGFRARIVLSTLGDDLAITPGSEVAWDVTVRPTRIGAFEPVPAGTLAGSSGPGCDTAAWAGPETFVELCFALVADANGNPVPSVRLEPVGGRPTDVALGGATLDNQVAWLVDTFHRLVFCWQPLAHRMQRLDIETGKVVEQVLGSGDGSLENLRAISVEAPPSPFPPPIGRSFWQPTRPAGGPLGTALVGSADGSLLYAAGFGFPTTPGSVGDLDSTGIWVFDSHSLDLLAHWQPVAAYDSLALTPNGRYLLAMGNPGGKELDLFGNHGRELALIDPTDGSTIAILRRLVLQLGGSPELLPPPPPG
jgi:hypothetical protein